MLLLPHSRGFPRPPSCLLQSCCHSFNLHICWNHTVTVIHLNKRLSIRAVETKKIILLSFIPSPLLFALYRFQFLNCIIFLIPEELPLMFLAGHVSWQWISSAFVWQGLYFWRIVPQDVEFSFLACTSSNEMTVILIIFALCVECFVFGCCPLNMICLGLEFLVFIVLRVL